MTNEQNIMLPVEELARRIQAALVPMPAIVGNVAVNFSLDNFKRQGFQGAVFQPWKPRKNPTAWGKAPKRNGRSLLVDTSKLKRSVRLMRADWDMIVVGSSDPKAKAHNEGVNLGKDGVIEQHVNAYTRKVTTLGIVKTVSRKKTTGIKFGRKETGTQEVKAHVRKIKQRIPARTFLADSPYLRSQVMRAASAQILKALK